MTELLLVTETVEVSRLVTGPLDNNVYFVRCLDTGECLMIDAPGGNPALLVSTCRHLRIDTVLVTHGHFDHVGAIEELRNAGLRVGIGSPDSAMAPNVDFTINDGDTFEVGRIRLQAIATPGHTPGSTCLLVAAQDIVFTGDTLFPGGPGATRWPYSSFETIIASIRERLFTLAPDTVVFPGHGASTTIGLEKPQLEAWLASIR